MKKLLALAVMVVLLGAVQGCGVQHTRGNQSLKGTSVTQLEERLQIGVTTKREVENWFGTPSGITKTKSGDRWRYDMHTSEARVRGETFIPVVGGLLGGVDHKDEHRWIDIDFNKNGIVESYNFDSSDGSGRT